MRRKVWRRHRTARISLTQTFSRVWLKGLNPAQHALFYCVFWKKSSSSNAELEAKHQKYKGRVVLRGDIVKDDSGAYAVFTEQGSSASQMTAANVMDVISRLQGCAGQAADAVSADTQVKMEDAPSLLKIQSQNVQIFGYVHQNTWPKS